MPSPRKIVLLKRWLNILMRRRALAFEEEAKENEDIVVRVPELDEISEILPGQLYLSGCRVATADRLASLGIRAVVRALTEREERVMTGATDCATDLPDHIRVLYIRLLDSESSDLHSHFEDVSRFIDAHLTKGEKVLVHCGAGISRSSALIMAYLITYKHSTLRAAYALLRSKRKIVRPNNGFFRQLIEHERQTRDDGRASVRMILTANGSPMPDIVYESVVMAKFR